jgi:hypothetical protein
MPSWRDPNEDDFRAGQDSFSSGRRKRSRTHLNEGISQTERDSPATRPSGTESGNVYDDERTERLFEAIYFEYRNVLLNSEYCWSQRQYLPKLNSLADLIITISASGSAIATIGLWKLQLVLILVSTVTAILASLKPVLNLPRKIAEYAQLGVEYTGVAKMYENIADQIHRSSEITHQVELDIRRARERTYELTRIREIKLPRSLGSKVQHNVHDKLLKEFLEDLKALQGNRGRPTRSG